MTQTKTAIRKNRTLRLTILPLDIIVPETAAKGVFGKPGHGRRFHGVKKSGPPGPRHKSRKKTAQLLRISPRIHKERAESEGKGNPPSGGIRCPGG